jgi:hypothetical protein
MFYLKFRGFREIQEAAKVSEAVNISCNRRSRQYKGPRLSAPAEQTLLRQHFQGLANRVPTYTEAISQLALSRKARSDLKLAPSYVAD